MKKHFLIALLGIFAIGLFLLGSKNENPPHLLLVTIDTLRADRLGGYGCKKGLTPNLDKLADQGALFERAYAQSPLTLPSHTSILTGTNPTFHGVKDNSFYRLATSVPTLATILKEYGYRTAAVVSGATVSRGKGLARGFSEYDDVPDTMEEYAEHSRRITERIAEKSVEAALKQIERFQETPGPFFLWLHLFDPHADYNPPSSFREKFSDLYDAEVAYTDHCLGHLFGRLQKTGLEENTIIVVMADHGEGLGEHGEASHGYFLYNTTLHIPLIVKAPSVPPSRIAHTVRSIDVMPTVLTLMDIEEKGMAQGIDLSPWLVNGGTSERFPSCDSYAETHFPHHAFGWRISRSLTEGRYKYIDTKKGELYDLAADGREGKNLLLDASPDAIAVVQRMKTRLLQYESRNTFMGEEDPANLQKMQTLGYLSMPEKADSKKQDHLPDASEMKEIIKMFIRGQTFLGLQRTPEAIESFSSIVQQDPENVSAFMMLGKAYLQIGNLEQARTSFERLSRLRPNLAGPKKAVLDVLMQEGKYGEARTLIEQIIKMEGGQDAIVVSRLAYLELQEEKYERAREYAEKATLLDPDLPGAWFYLGMAHQGMKKYREATDSFLQGIRSRPIWPEAYYRQSACLYELGRKKEAILSLQKSLDQSSPSDPFFPEWKRLLEKWQSEK